MAVLVAFAAIVTSCTTPLAETARCEAQAGDAGQSGQVEELRVEVLDQRHHDSTAFTQGLLLHEGLLYESTGQYGQSSLREVDPQTGDVLRRVNLPDDLFGEGLERVEDRLIQLTWKEGQAQVYDLPTFRELAAFRYEGEGWGLCFDGQRLVMSNGTDQLTFRDPETFEVTGQLSVTLRGKPVERLNELECVGDVVYANVWQTDNIVKIDMGSGEVRAVIDAAGLLAEDERRAADVLNGIAFQPEVNSFLITGKWWPKLYEACFVPANEG